MLQELQNRNFRLTAAANGDAPEVRKTLASWNIDYIPVPLERTGLNPLSDARTVLSLTRTLQRLKPDVYFGYTIKPVVFGTIAARLAGVSRRAGMLTGLGYAFTEGREKSLVGKVARRLLRTAVDLSHVTIFHNSDDLEFMRDLGVIGVHTKVGLVNGSGVDLAHFSPARMPEGPPVFLLIARLLRDKGIVEYVEAARQVKAVHPNAIFRLAGPLDPNPAALKPADVQAWVNDGVIEYLGPLLDVRPALADCHVYVLPSYREGTPRTVLEAMATGRPIITTDAPGCRQTVADGWNGFLVPVRDSKTLADRMRHFVEQPQDLLLFGENSRLRVLEKFEAGAVAHETADLILGTRSPPRSPAP